MKRSNNAVYPSTRILIIFMFVWTPLARETDYSSNHKDETSLSTPGLLHLLGYTAEEHYVTTSDGYILQLVEAGNPQVNATDKDVVLFLHGTLADASCFIIDTDGASPRDYSDRDAGQMSQAALRELYDGNPNAESLALMLLDFGHKVIFLNRRGTINSQGYVGKNDKRSMVEDIRLPDEDKARQAVRALFNPANSSTNPDPLEIYFEELSRGVHTKYWDFSLDEEVKYDLPETIDFILNLTARSSLAIVAWSSGGAIVEMALSEQPDLSQKISKALLWSPALYLGRPLRNRLATVALYPLISTYIGPIMPQFSNNIVSFLAIRFCSLEIFQQTLCQAAIDFIVGYGGNQQRLKPGLFISLLAPVSSHHFAQLAQATTKKKMHHYDYGFFKNIAVYGSPWPPLYDVSKITSTRMYLWGAEYDSLVDIDDVRDNADDLQAPTTFTRLEEAGLYFSHLSYIIHKDKSELLFIPCLRMIESQQN